MIKPPQCEAVHPVHDRCCRDAGHPNHELPYVQNCEANSIVVIPEMDRRLCEQTILKYLGNDAEERFDRKRDLVKERIDAVLEKSKAGGHIRRAVKALEKYE